ncbi:MAG: NAD-binding protein [Chitinivibrionales bacterium]|nr:NAD-binding protein [Chitinivibrionales bacterium]MBD3396173.1 NAD-binding protein [Chitinivibrionales bacterium]
MHPENTTIGFIGTGVMGKSMAGHLLKAGYGLHVYNRTKPRADELVAGGATWQDSPGKVAANADVIITIVGFPNDVEEVYLGDDGILANARKGSIVVDMTTSRPDLAVKIYNEAKAKGIASLDAPVSGGDSGAREARLSIMAGGDKDTFDAMFPLFEIMGKNIVYQGPAGSGQHTKMCNQIAIAAGLVAVCEALVYAKKSGLDQSTVLKSIASGAAGSWSLSNYGPRMIAGSFDPGFYVKHFIKDMKIASESARAMGMNTPGLDLALSKFEKLAAEGGADLGVHGLYTLFDK